MAAFLKECLGISDAALRKSIEGDSDWALVIKLHAYVEASLNFLLVKHFGDQRLEEVIAYLDISDRRRGKLAFIKALALLPREYRSFIQKLSELRNRVAHDVKNIDFDLKLYMESLDSKQFKEFADSLIPLRKRVLGFWAGKSVETAYKQIKTEPRYAILYGVLGIMLRIYQKQQVRKILAEGKLRRSKSNPKAP
jgi:hypothetical protein